MQCIALDRQKICLQWGVKNWAVVNAAATTVTYPPRDSVVTVNSTAFFACQASYNPAIDITYDWWHNNYKIMFIKLKNLGNSVYIWREANYERVGWFAIQTDLSITGGQCLDAAGMASSLVKNPA